MSEVIPKKQICIAMQKDIIYFSVIREVCLCKDAFCFPVIDRHLRFPTIRMYVLFLSNFRIRFVSQQLKDTFRFPVIVEYDSPPSNFKIRFTSK